MSEQVTDYTSANRSSLERTVEGTVRRLLGFGLNAKARLTTSLRVGSGSTTLAGIDGTDGIIMADGVTAGFLTRDRADSTKRGVFKRSTNIIIGTELADLIQIDPTTGFATLVTAGAWTAVTGGVGYTNGWSDFGGAFQTMRYRKTILGDVEVQGSMKSGTLGAAAFTLPTGFRPPAHVQIPCIDGANTAQYVLIQSSGAVVPETGNTAIIGINATFSTI